MQRRCPRPVRRYPRKLFPRPVRRWPRARRYCSDAPFFWQLKKRPQEEYPELYEEFKQLKGLFKAKGRKLEVYCVKRGRQKIVDLDVCLCRCRRKCKSISFRNLVGDGESPAEYIDDFIKYQRLVNMIYGTVRKKDIQPKT